MSEPAVGQPDEPARVDIRIGNVERDAVVSRLQTAFGEGRLDVHEFDERVAQVYAARTVGELAPLTADLPAAGPAAHPQTSPAPRLSTPPTRDRRRNRQRNRQNDGRALVWAWRAWATAVSINLVIWTLVSLGTGHLHYFWPMWVAGPWGAVLLVSTIFRNADRPPQN